MSLWSNTDEAKSMPTWYARHCMIEGTMTKNGKLDFAQANTQFADGDCVVYFSNDPFTGLTNGGVYYLKRHPDFKYAIMTEVGQPAIFISPKENTDHLFVKYDTKETTKDGTVRPAIFPVDKDLAKKRISGMVSPGWYRYFKYTTHDSIERMRLELLVSMKGFDLNPDTPLDVGQGDVNEPTKDVVVVADAPIVGVKAVTGKSIKADDLKVDSGRLKFVATGDVTVKNLHTTGDLPKSTSNAAFSIESDEWVEINGANLEQTSYNSIEIGLGNTAPKKILIQDVHFKGKLSNNAINIFANAPDAEIVVRRCEFDEVSNAFRISNRTNVPATFIIEDCVFHKWESKLLDSVGCIIMQDYTAPDADTMKKDARFKKLKFIIRNCIGPDGKKIAFDDVTKHLGCQGLEQFAYVWSTHTGTVAYDPEQYPTFVFE